MTCRFFSELRNIFFGHLISQSLSAVRSIIVWSHQVKETFSFLEGSSSKHLNFLGEKEKEQVSLWLKMERNKGRTQSAFLVLCLSLNCRTSWSFFCHGPNWISIKHSVSWFKPSSTCFPEPFAQKQWISHKNKQCQTAAQTLSQAEIQFLAWSCSNPGYYPLWPLPLHNSLVLRHISCPPALADLPVPHTYLRGNIVRSPTESACLRISKHVLLAHPKVSNFDVALIVQEDVVQLQVSVEEEKETSFFKVFQKHTSYFSRLHLLTCSLPLCRAYMLETRRKAEGWMRNCSLGLQHLSSSFLLSQHWFICWRRHRIMERQNGLTWKGS